MLTCRLSTTGAAAATENCRVGGDVGVTSNPAVVVKVGARVTVSATVPVCIAICDPCPAKSALVLPVGIVKFTVRPPVEN